MIAVTFALPVESTGLIAQLRGANRIMSGDAPIIEGKIDNRLVAVFHTGVGREKCRSEIEKLLSGQQFDCLISAGFAGAVRESLQVGDLFLAENFSDRQLLFNARRILVDNNACTGRLFTSTSIIESVAQREEVARVSGAAAVDMETEAIAQACRARGTPMLSIRVISDSLDKRLPAPAGILFDVERQRTNLAKLVPYVLSHPTIGWHLIRFARRIARSREALTNAIVAFVREL
jgi:adenosylhomocysteine nucleosidase